MERVQEDSVSAMFGLKFPVNNRKKEQMKQKRKNEELRSTMKRSFIIAAVVLALLGISSPLFGGEQVCSWDLTDSGGFGTKTHFQSSTGELIVSVDENTGAWSGLHIGNPSFQKNSTDFPTWNKGFLVFEMKGGPDKEGKLCEIRKCQIFLAYRNEEGKLTAPTAAVQFPRYAENGVIPADSFATVRVPLKKINWKESESPINTIVIQFSGNGKTAGGFTIRNLRFEIPEE